MLELSVTAIAAVRVNVSRHFTAIKAGALHGLALRLPRGTVIDLYFRDVRECQDVALLSLARDATMGTARYVFHGLSHHQRTLLRYLGAGVRVFAVADAT